MYLTPEARIADYETKGWWRGITVDELLKETLAGDHAELAHREAGEHAAGLRHAFFE